MRMTPLGGASGLAASALALGSMDWGARTSEAEAHRLLDQAYDGGIRLLDTAEVYPVPFAAATFGAAEAVIGSWLRRRPGCGVAVATKALGPGPDFPWVRDGRPRLDRAQLDQALDGSLRRLGVDCVDLFQLHWPERAGNYFGRLDYRHQPELDGVPLEETVAALDGLVRAGKIRRWGLCNETPWGVMRQLHLAATTGAARPVSIQNPYNLLNRVFEIGLAEVAHREDVKLLAYSPLAHGVLSGKYLGGALPSDSRFAKYPFFKRYRTERAERAAAAYADIAARAGLAPAALALGFVLSRPFVAAAVVAVSNAAQLDQLLAAARAPLPADVLEAVEAVHASEPNPCP